MKSKKMSQEIDQLITLLQEINKKLKPKSRLEELTEEIKKTSGLKHLLVDDPQKEYPCSENTYSTEFNHLQKCVILTSEFKFLEEYIDLYLTEHPETINHKNEKGWTTLIIAARNSNCMSTERTVEVLLNHGADINLQEKDGWTALIFAAANSCTDSSEKTVELLLKHGADVNLQNNNKNTAIMFAVSHPDNTGKTIELLLNHGADVNLQNIVGCTALMFAFECSCAGKIIKLLLNHGADVNLQNKYEDTGLKLALKNYKKTGKGKIIKLIIENMDNCDILIYNKKLVKYLYDKYIPDDIIELAIQKGAKRSDLVDQRLHKLLQL